MTSLRDGIKAAGSAATKHRILLLYADAGPAAELAQRLSSANYEVVSCPLSIPGYAWTEDLHPDLILVDLPSQEEQALQACEAICAQADCPVIAMCELRSELLISRLLALGIDDYLAHSIGGRELCARIEAMLRRLNRYAGLARPQHVGGLILSSMDLSVECGGVKTFLSPIEFRLLSCLASAPGKVLTHRTLMSRVWGSEYGDDRNSLQVYIRYLRQKLEQDPAKPRMILNEWGVGYRFQPPGELPG